MTGSSSTSSETRAVARGTVRGALRVPPSKSVTHRQLALALLAGAPVEVRHPLRAEDTALFLGVLRGLGWRVDEVAAGGGEIGDAVRLTPGRPPTRATFDCGNAGTLLRFLVALLTVVPGEWTLDGTPRLRQRPIGPLVAALAPLGARLEWGGEPGHPPVRVHGGSLVGGETALDAGESSQYLSALLLAGLRAPRPLLVRVLALASAPYVDVTLALVREWGGTIAREGDDYVVTPGLAPRSVVAVEGDFSAAAYPAAAAALTAGEVMLRGLRRDSAQGDRRFLALLEEMGASVACEGSDSETLRVRGSGALHAVDADLGDMPDQVPTLAALAPFASGTTRIRNVAHLRIKESDRLAAMAQELRRAGATVDEQADGLVIPGVWASAPPPATPVTVETHDDHRIAMSMALVGLRRGGIRVHAPHVVGKSYPGFWRDLEMLLAGETP
jgi:3-phosphoshikimate 1-carboxyvinyltransferase